MYKNRPVCICFSTVSYYEHSKKYPMILQNLPPPLASVQVLQYIFYVISIIIQIFSYYHVQTFIN